MKDQFRCTCPITSSLDILGDKWTLVIIKQMLLEGKKTFKDFLEADEAIATNILAARLKMLEQFHMVEKRKLPHNKKTNLYVLTQKALNLTTVIVEIGLWGENNLKEFNPVLEKHPQSDVLTHHKAAAIEHIKSVYKAENWEEA